MSSALIGFIGVIAGVLTTGGIQAVLGWRDRKHQARVAAEMIFSDLALAEVTLESAIAMDTDPALERLTRYVASWPAERRALAAGITPRDFHLIAIAFKTLEDYVSDPRYNLRDILATVVQAREIAWRASGMKNGTHGTDTAPDGPEPGSQSG